jgi:hypothetical protein
MAGLAGAAAVVAITIGTGTGSLPPASRGVEACGSYADLRTMLVDRFGERPASSGVAQDGTLIQLFASDSADTWTMVNVAPDGRACVLAVGRDWRAMLASIQGQPV